MALVVADKSDTSVVGEEDVDRVLEEVNSTEKSCYCCHRLEFGACMPRHLCLDCSVSVVDVVAMVADIWRTLSIEYRSLAGGPAASDFVASPYCTLLCMAEGQSRTGAIGWRLSQC